MLTSNDYQEALDVQDACNLSGVVRAWAKMTKRIWEDLREKNMANTDNSNHHPINVLFASKVAQLTGCEIGLEFSKAYGRCCILAKKDPAGTARNLGSKENASQDPRP